MNDNQKEEVRARLLHLRGMSKDPYYDQYLNQMLRDLESEKATPAQVAKEADRTYRLYLERMAQQKMQAHGSGQEQTGGNAEFKIGAGIFSIIGAVFVLAAFIVFGVNFLQGIWQGLCLYAVSVFVVLLSELLVRRINSRACSVITAIGIGGLFASTIINYSILGNMNEPAALIVTMAIALISIFLSRKKDSTSIRLITVLGCYLCFFPRQYYDSDIIFLCKSLMLLIVNGVGILLPNQKNRKAISAVHMAACALFMLLMAVFAFSGYAVSPVVGVAGYVLGGLIPLNLIYYREKDFSEVGLNVIYGISLGLAFVSFFILYSLVDYDAGTTDLAIAFQEMLMGLQALAVSFIFFVLWGKDRRKWIQHYYLSGVLFIIGFAVLPEFFEEMTINRLVSCAGVLAVFLLTRFLSHVKELTVLDCILEVIAALCGFSLAFSVGVEYGWLFAVVLFLALLCVKRLAVFHEMVVLFLFASGVLFPAGSSIFLPAQIGTLFLLFLLMNHLPVLKMRGHLPYNIVSVVLIFLYSLGIVFRQGEWIGIITMLLGAVAVAVMFCPRYGMEISRKYLLVAGYLIVMIFFAHFPVPAIKSALLMIVAIGCIVAGVWKKDKVYRVFGLVMALLVCAKLIVFDFVVLETLTKVIIFFIVGIVALAISFLYIYLERKVLSAGVNVTPGEAVPTQEIQYPVEAPIVENEENVQNISERNMEE